MHIRPGGPGPVAPPSPTDPNHDAGAGPRRAKAFTAVLGERGGSEPRQPAPAPPRATAPRKSASAPALVSRSPVRALLDQTLGSERRVDTLLAAAARGKTFSPSELLALQATVFRYSQAVEIVSRATDKLVAAVKQTMGTQV